MSDENIFDPTLKKKKKKKRLAFDFGNLETEYSQGDPHVSDSVPDGEKPVVGVENGHSTNQVDSSDSQNGKVFGVEEIKSALKHIEESVEENDFLNFDEDIDFSLTKKKKKKNINLNDIEPSLNDVKDTFDDGVVLKILNGSSTPWCGTERDYTYEELLTRVFDLMLERNPDMVAGEKKKFIMKPPKTLRVGSKKTSFANFLEICRLVHRQPKHLQAFVLTELGTSGSIDGNNQLIIRGRFQQRQIETVLRSYIKEYVTCHTCHSPDTLLEKDVRLFFLKCETCGSKCSVSTIKSGFQAVTGKRAALRDKT